MNRYTMLFKYGNCTRMLKIKNKMKVGWFTNKVGKISRYFVGVFNRIVILLTLVGYEMIIANSVLRASLANYHLISNAHSWRNKWNNCELYRRLRYTEVLLNFRWEHSLSLMTVLCLIPQATSYVAGRVEFCCFSPLFRHCHQNNTSLPR